MKPIRIALTFVTIAAFSSCRPAPIDIAVPQTANEMTISSFTPDDHSVFVSVGYAVSSMRRLIDTSAKADYEALPEEMLVDSALVLLRADGGSTDTLTDLGSGLYGRRDLALQPNAGYTLLVEDRGNGRRASARTAFVPRPEADTMYVCRRISKGDTLHRLRLCLPAAKPGERILICYNTAAAMRLQQRAVNRDLSALYDFQPRRLEILRVPDTARNGFSTELTLQVSSRDTVLVQVSGADAAFCEYLNAYKRAGGLFSQLSGEPVNLQGNIQKGFGYFSMYLSNSGTFDLNKL